MEIDSDLGLGDSSPSSSSSSESRRDSIRKRFSKRRKQSKKRPRGSVSRPAAKRAKLGRAQAIIRSVFPDAEAETLYDRFVEMSVSRLEEEEAGEVGMFDRVLPAMRGAHVPVLPNRMGASSSSSTFSLATAVDEVVADTSAMVRSSLASMNTNNDSGDEEDDVEYLSGTSRENPATVPIKFYEQGIPLTGVTDANTEIEYESYGADLVGAGWTSYFDETYTHLRDEYERVQRSMKSVSEVDFFLDPNTHNVDTPGGLRFKSVQEQLDSYGVVRSADQRTFHEAMINATLPLIYGDSWEECSTGVMRERKIERVDQEVCMVCVPFRID